jgi:hypothetical protein
VKSNEYRNFYLFTGKGKSLPLMRNLVRGYTQAGSIMAYKYLAMMEVAASDSHTAIPSSI